MECKLSCREGQPCKRRDPHGGNSDRDEGFRRRLVRNSALELLEREALVQLLQLNDDTLERLVVDLDEASENIHAHHTVPLEEAARALTCNLIRDA